MGSAGGDCCHVALPSPWYRTYACDCASDCDIATSKVTVMTTQHVPLEQSVCGPSELSKSMSVWRRTTWHEVSAESPCNAADACAATSSPEGSPWQASRAIRGRNKGVRKYLMGEVLGEPSPKSTQALPLTRTA